jgi:hypothetical protein
MSHTPDAEAIDALLVDAFGSVPKPPREALINRQCEACLETSEAFADKAWQEVTIGEIERGQAIELLTATAFGYYLPALIRWYVRDASAADGWLHVLPSELTPTKTGAFRGERAFLAERHGGFDDRQRAAIAACLDWAVRREEAMAGDDAITFDRVASRLRRALAFWSSTR